MTAQNAFQRTAIAALSCLTALAFAAAAHAAAAPPMTGAACMPATPAPMNQTPIGGTPANANDFSRPANVTAIPGVIAAGQSWTKVWQMGGNSADGVVPDRSGALLIAGEDYDTAFRVDAADKETRPYTGIGGLSSLGFDRRGNLYGVTRTERPGSTKANRDSIVNSIVQITPQSRVITDKWATGGPLTVRPNDLSVDAAGGAYFTAGCVYYATPKGVTVAADNIRPNGIVLSADEKQLFVTNGGSVVVYDVTGAGTLGNRRDFAQLPPGDSGDGIALDSMGRLYVTTVQSQAPGVHVFDKAGAHLGLIPTPRPVISLAFAGKDKKVLYVVGSGADDESGKMIRVGPQQTAATVYRINTIAAGLPGRAK
jgi:gluconolactonase